MKDDSDGKLATALFSCPGQNYADKNTGNTVSKVRVPR